MTPVMIVAAADGQALGRILELVKTARQIQACQVETRQIQNDQIQNDQIQNNQIQNNQIPSNQVGCGRAPSREPEITLVLAGEHPRDLAGKVMAAAGDTDLNPLALVLPEDSSWDLLKTAVIDLVREIDPAMVLFAQTTMAREVGPALAIALGGVSIANVSAVKPEGQALVFTRPVMDNTRIQEVRVPADQLMVVSLAAGAKIDAGEGLALSSGEKAWGGKRSDPVEFGRDIAERQISKPEGTRIRRLGVETRQGAGQGKLAQAPVVVAAGRGIGERENLEQVAAFAAALPKAVMAASRPLVDQGWVGYEHQVGITGAVVCPDLYIALGISGSSQHLAGMAGSKWVVSVNNSPDAPICRQSDLCIQADAMAFIAAFLEAGLEARLEAHSEAHPEGLY